MLIYLNGTSSSGKTSIALELQKNIREPVLYFSIDTILYSLAKEDLEAIMGKRPYRSPIKWDAIFSGYFSSIAALVGAGNQVIADCPVHSQKLLDDFNKYIAPIPERTLVRIDCPLSILEDREKARQDRAIGVAKRQFDGIHRYLSYDFKVDSDQAAPADLARVILSHIGMV